MSQYKHHRYVRKPKKSRIKKLGKTYKQTESTTKKTLHIKSITMIAKPTLLNQLTLQI